MTPTWAERQIIYARRLGVMRTLKPGTMRVYDALLSMELDAAAVTIAAIARTARVSRSVVTRALAELQELNVVTRFTAAAGDNAGCSYQVQDLEPRWTMRQQMMRGTPHQN